MRLILISTVVLFLSTASRGQGGGVPIPQGAEVEPEQGTKHATISEVFEGGPQSCLRFAEMAEKANAVETLQDITEDEFRQAYKSPKKIVRNPGKVFLLEKVEYIDTGTDGHPSFEKITPHEGKEHEFLHWYNAEDGKDEMFFAGVRCFSDLSKQVTESKDPNRQRDLLAKYTEVMNDLNYANSIAKSAADDLARMGMELVGGYAVELDRVKDRYNQLVANVKAYDEAVNEYMNTMNHILSTNRVSPPSIALPPVRVQPITCTGNTLAFSQATTYPNSTDTMTNATTTAHCE